MGNILGIDLGTNSTGLSVRNTDKGRDLKDQLDFYTSIIFKSGIGNGKKGEFSYAAERTKKRSPRRLYQARKYRIWETLKVLIEFGFCPLSKDELEKWSRYDKKKGLKRQYPIDNVKFEQWVRLDFDGNGIADYSSPYQLRAELMHRQFDFSTEIDRFKLGRALYHIAQRRGFKSSKGETIKEHEKKETDDNIESDIDVADEKKISEEKKAKSLVEYMREYNHPTVGSAFAQLEKSGIRIRNSVYQAVRSQYKEEIQKIFEYQKELDSNSDFYKRIISERKGEGSIFYKRPLRSQKGLVGKCTLECDKARCPVSHPEYEKFRAWCFINNIQYRKSADEKLQELSLEQKNKLYNKVFLQTRTNFKFQKIREWLENDIKDSTHYYKLEYLPAKEERTINYKDNTNVSGCPISGRLRNILGDNWEYISIQSQKNRTNKRTGEIHRIAYTANDIWHICFSFDDDEYVTEFAKKDLHFDEEKTKQLVRLWGAIPQGYSMLSLKAIHNINRFLQKGLIYSDSVLLAKLPEIFNNKWDENESSVIESINKIIKQNRNDKFIFGIVNELIANFKSLDSPKFAFKDTEYKLVDDDLNDIKKITIGNVGERSWEKKTTEERQEIILTVEKLYQQFFASSERDYYKLPKLSEALSKYLQNHYAFLSEKDLKKIYHPSMIEFYAPAKEYKIDDDREIKLLGSPVIGALKNPMAMRVLYILRKQINQLLIDGIIEEDTRIVVEMARELNDANMRWAIEAYQREREKENKEFERAIKDYFPNRAISDEDIDKVRLLVDQRDIQENGELKDEIFDANKKKHKSIEKVETYKKDITKYRLWLEQGCRCIYTGKIINITTLFDDNEVDFEHTIPRSISFDNSLSNLTVCDAHFNRTIKKNQIPSQLANYDDILLRIQPWIDKVETMKDNIEFWKKQSQRAQDKARKDYCIQQRHLWEIDLDYWQKKVHSFTLTEVTSGFRSSQLNDTRIITKYAYHYLRSLFNRVDVQNGQYTSDFRKMLGVQNIDEKKNRDKHSHHAIDATMLTLIPVAAKRDKMLEIFYRIQEEKRLNRDISELQCELNKYISECNFGNVSQIGDFIEQNILVNHLSNDQTLTPGKKKMRKRGKEIFVRDINGNIKNKWVTGDCIRGQLHGETFYGAIKQAQKNERGEIIRDENGKIQIGEQILYVVRRDLKYKKNEKDSGFRTWEEIEKVIVDKSMLELIKKQFPDGTSFKDACEQGIYMLDKNKNKVNKIRHIRCKTTIKNPLKIKKQTYSSSKSYKQFYYAEMGDLYVMCKYENQSKTVKEFRIWSLFDICENRKYGLKDIPNEIFSKEGEKLISSQQLKTGDMILIYNENKTELKELDQTTLTERLYVICGFENDGNRIILRKSINAQQEKDLGKGESIKDFNIMPNKIRCGINTLKYIVQSIDFEIYLNHIKFLF